jgi:hypothetical protein
VGKGGAVASSRVTLLLCPLSPRQDGRYHSRLRLPGSTSSRARIMIRLVRLRTRFAAVNPPDSGISLGITGTQAHDNKEFGAEEGTRQRILESP